MTRFIFKTGHVDVLESQAKLLESMGFKATWGVNPFKNDNTSGFVQWTKTYKQTEIRFLLAPREKPNFVKISNLIINSAIRSTQETIKARIRTIDLLMENT